MGFLCSSDDSFFRLLIRLFSLHEGFHSYLLTSGDLHSYFAGFCMMGFCGVWGNMLQFFDQHIFVWWLGKLEIDFLLIHGFFCWFWGVHPSLSGRNFGQFAWKLFDYLLVVLQSFCTVVLKKELNGEKKSSLSRDRKHLTIWVFPKNRGTPKWKVYSGKPY